MTNTIRTEQTRPVTSQANTLGQATYTGLPNSSPFAAGGVGMGNLQSSLVQLLLALVQQLLSQLVQQRYGGAQTTTPQQETMPAPAATTPAATTPAATTPAATTPVATTPAATTPVATTPVATTPVATTPVATTPVATTPVATTPVTPGQTVIDVYLLGGQSNAAGLGAARLEKALEASLGADTEQHKTNVFSYAAGGTNLFSQWKADGTDSAAADGTQYKTFQSKFNAYMTSLQKANPDAQINVSGMFWHQGESDALSTQTNRDQYDENLTRFIQDVRATTKVNNLPFMIGKLSDGQTGMTAAARGDIQKAQDAVGAADPWAVSVDMNTAQPSGIHFTAKGYDEMARLFAESYKAGFKS